ncbi:NADP-dependent oxidoreductase [Haloflavibacter putidus]|uniref:NADP-dependent oxidoreductase n=1 Tax=Haloflavibacter putidus TaxID=2576776 RepID=A0A507ZS12_9FLAO|nr:NADP-dependent oxidoreductase [Haloflavibacter putidus]TQD40586.1 NADP-dependent oxidoreductase [Haloflavibacter putidus]
MVKAVILKNTGGSDQLNIEEVAKPEINARQILIKVKAFGINPIEVKTRNGNKFSEKLLTDKPSILGWDVSGIVEEVGNEVKNFEVGDRVCGMLNFPDFGKTYAQYTVASPQDLAKFTEHTSFEEAAGLPLAGLTAYQALKHAGQLQPGQKVLIHAGGGGVGHLGIQFAKNLGAHVSVTASGEKEELVRHLGADNYINYKEQKFEETLKDIDLVFDLVGGTYIDRSLKTLKKGGIIISIPSSANQEVVEKANQAGCLGIRFVVKPTQLDLRDIVGMLDSKNLQIEVSKTFKMEEIRQAHDSLEKGGTQGKIVVQVD